MFQGADPELTAMQAIMGALTPLHDDARRRVLGYVLNRLGWAPGTEDVLPFQTAAGSGSAGPPHVVTGEVPKDIRSLREKKQPRTAVEMAALMGYYLSEAAPPEIRKSEFGTGDVTQYFKQAGYPVPPRPRKTLADAKAAGYLDSRGHGTYKLNPVGYNLVEHNLPADGTSKPSRSTRRPGAKKGSRKAVGKSVRKATKKGRKQNKRRSR